ncbi:MULTISPECIES: DNA-directed RNA polymerase subunit delta [Leuconostoc]|jgi:DNA-directed RNA polymerase subunit delta|uniref:Probable DNA-directed RNA polymerase subunit delta n=2 Tax=Leuconostoc citreum TaxID=33964 RepID=RPOE_LEUCK|nr:MULTISPECIES: DNA-directed RNA polymerase subunit delta [Leuconostoc]B1MXM6.1 RecName: Full=Probable DNA-directed RNA polymerase subunit delta; AltName: Full=RNAP delta factor [Leuconostoc citreum KM20]ACA82278.1 Probable DNA-directed RNA polymerase delta subunit [Leuconostoc citreum KM20]KAF0261646.1 DNA-directed RNA polymerase subunit delta [Leuconostoc citreum]MBA5937284.1 DNA-directed RNA polymerase subunit delta [Leuconostoc citreum]MBU7450591.1 DNA-directed RNA polymerase subunit delt
MALTQLGNHPKEELALVEIATAILSEHKTVMPFSSLVEEIQDFLAVDAETFQSRLSQFYTDLNTDGSFISLGNNEWGLRAWYPVDAIDESIHEIDDDDDAPKRKKAAKKVNVFADSAADDDVIDYNDDDPEDEDFGEVTEEETDVDVDDSEVEVEDDEEEEIAVGDDETIDDNLTELTGTNDLDDLSDGDIEK